MSKRIILNEIKDLINNTGKFKPLLFGKIEGVYYLIQKKKISKVAPETLNNFPENVCLNFETGKDFDFIGNTVHVPDKKTAFNILKFLSEDLKVPLHNGMVDILLLKFKHLIYEQAKH
jgi:hypothetical protein